MPRRYPAEVRRQVIELARSGTKVAQLAETFGMSDATSNLVRRLGVEFVLDVAPASRKPALVTAHAQRRGTIVSTIVSVVAASSV